MGRRVLILALGLALTGAAGVMPAAQAAPAPSVQQLQAAQSQVGSAQQHLNDVRVQAEIAAEAYNGAELTAEQASARSTAAAVAAAAAAAAAGTAAATSTAAASRAQQTAAAALAARAEQNRAQQALLGAQAQLNATAAGAYRSGGPLAMYSGLLTADPVTFLEGQQWLNRVNRHQKDLVDQLASAKAAAATASAAAAQVEQAAKDTADQAAGAARQAADDAQQQTDLAANATSAAQDAQRAVAAAATSRQHAQLLVSSAQNALGTASSTSAQLAAQAEQARRDAAALIATARQSSKVTRPGQPAQPGTTLAGNSAGVTAVNAALRQIGVPYSWGGGSPDGPTLGFAQGADTVGFDCSGLTLFAWAHAGVSLGHYTGSQWTAGRQIAYTDLQPGDLVFFANNTSDPVTIHHVGLYVGGGNMVNAPHTGDVVRVASIAGFSGYIGAVRPG